jgi:hypothetical protein
MKLLMGPVLGFRGLRQATWCVSALAVTEEPEAPVLEWRMPGDAGPRRAGAPVALLQVDRLRVWRFDMEIPLGHEAMEVTYSLGGEFQAAFTVPPLGRPPDCAYASCNGFSSTRDMKKVAEKNERWTDLAARHGTRPFHLLLMGGDQVYSDSLWEVLPALKRWVGQKAKKRRAAPFTPAMQDAVDAFFLDLYVSRWRQPEPRAVFARIPTVMMWDDHDIFDGWGSYDPDDQACEVYQGIYAIARKHFQVFQLQVAPEDRHPCALPGQEAFSYGHQFGELALAVLDMRSERSQTQVLSAGAWNAFYAWLAALQGCRHLLVMSSIPVVHPDFGFVERMLGVFPGRQDLEDDLRDHWLSRGHKTERLRLVHRLLDHARERACRVTILSGDVHVGAIGVIESIRAIGAPENSQVINQLTSSGIVHPSPPGIMLHFLESVGDKTQEIDRGITTRMLEFPGTHNRFLGTRNWLELQYDDQRRIWACWHLPPSDADRMKRDAATGADPDAEKPYTKVIHPCA